MYNKKYSQYKIKIEYLNGDSEEITYDDNVARDYKQSLEMYRETKEHYKNDCVIIKFCGITEDNEINILYEKNLISNEDKAEYEKEVRVAKTETQKLLEQHKELIETLDKRLQLLSDKYDLLNKNEDIELHNIESFKSTESIEDDIQSKLLIFNKIQNIRNERREISDELLILKPYHKRMTDSKVREIGFKIINDTLNQINTSKIRNEEKEYVQLNDETLEELNIMKKVKYDNIKMRTNLMSQLQPKYDKVVYDDIKMIITCYNKVKRCARL